MTETNRQQSSSWDLSHPRHRPGPHIVLLLKVHFLPDMQGTKSTVTIQFSTFHDCSATLEPKPHTSADKRLRTPRKVGAKSSLHSISLTLAWLPARHFNLISFPKLESVLIVKESSTGEHYLHMYTHTNTLNMRRHIKAYSSSFWGKVSDRPKLLGPGPHIHTKANRQRSLPGISIKQARL